MNFGRSGFACLPSIGWCCALVTRQRQTSVVTNSDNPHTAQLQVLSICSGHLSLALRTCPGIIPYAAQLCPRSPDSQDPLPDRVSACRDPKLLLLLELWRYFADILIRLPVHNKNASEFARLQSGHSASAFTILYSRILCGYRDYFQWRQAGLDEQLKFPVNALTLEVAGIGGIGACGDQDTRLHQSFDIALSIE